MSGTFRVGEWRVAPQLNRVECNGHSVHIEPKVMEVLVCLCQAKGEPVSKEHLFRQVWQDTFVTDDVLKRCIWQLRKAFQDDSKNPTVIETIAKGGYRVLLPVEVVETDAQEAARELQILSKARQTRRLIGVALVIGAVAGASLLLFLAGTKQRPTALDVEPLSSLPGIQGAPSFSPDGNQVAFTYITEGFGRPSDIYVKIMGDEKVIRLTTPPGSSQCGFWSPDGQSIAYSRDSPQGTGRQIMLMTPLGGSKRVIRKSTFGSCWMAWSPDGKLLAYSDEKDGHEGIFLMSNTGSDSHRLTTAPHNIAELFPAFSPDGQQIAFVRTSTIYGSDLYAVPVSGGEPRRVTFLNAAVNPPVWTRDGRSIVFSLGGWIDPLYATVTADGKKWMTGAYVVPAGGGEPQRLPLPHSNMGELAISLKGDKIAYTKNSVSMSIWKVPLPNPGTPASKFIASQSIDMGGEFSPDGSKIAFVSARDGFNAIWICNADGSDPIRLTTLHTGGSPAWSQDGTHILFDNRISGHSHLYSIQLDDHTVEQLTQGDFDDVTPAWSSDGKSIYFSSDRTGKWEVWKQSSASKQLSQVTRHGGTFPQETLDGKFVYYGKVWDGLWQSWQSGEVWRMSSAGGPEELVTREPGNDWRVRQEGIYFTGASDKTSKSYPVLKLFSFATRKAKIVGRLDKNAAWTSRNLAISPDGRFALYTQFDDHSQVIMVAKGLQL